MTNKDIRDIASYWGVECSDAAGLHERRVDTELMDFLDITGHIEGLKLHLRSLHNLTDEELRECFRLAIGIDSRMLFPNGINREDDNDKIEVYGYQDGNRVDLSIWTESGRMAATGIYAEGGLFSPLWNPAAIIGYLQSISIYVPGLIDLDYVTLG